MDDGLLYPDKLLNFVNIKIGYYLLVILKN